MIDWNDIGIYGNYERAPGDPVPPKVGDTEMRGQEKWCYLPKRDGTCTVFQWYRLYLGWDQRYRAEDPKNYMCDDPEVTAMIPESVHPVKLPSAGMYYGAGGGKSTVSDPGVNGVAGSIFLNASPSGPRP